MDLGPLGNMCYLSNKMVYLHFIKSRLIAGDASVSVAVQMVSISVQGKK